MKKKTTYLQKSKNKNTFRQFWLKINKKNKAKKEKEQIDDFFTHQLQIQDVLTKKENIQRKFIDYSTYYEDKATLLESKSLFDCFQGILHFIYFNSNNKFNPAELEFQFSYADSRIWIHQKLPEKEYDILNIFTYDDFKTEFKTVIVQEPYFGLTFKRIKINPIAYSIRAGLATRNNLALVSFIFYGYDEDLKKWDILDERANINDLLNVGYFGIFFTKNVNKYYSTFKILQTNPVIENNWGFSMSGFDIHGTLQYKDNYENYLEEYKSDTIFDTSGDFDYNPFMDMSDFII